MEEPPDATTSESPADVRMLHPIHELHPQSDITTSHSLVHLFPVIQSSQHNIDDEGQQPGQQTSTMQTLQPFQGQNYLGEAFQETPDIKPHLLVDDGNEQDPDVRAFQLHPVVWPLQEQQNLSPPLALAQHNPAVQPSSQNAAVLQNPAVPPGVVQNSVSVSQVEVQPDSAEPQVYIDTDVGTDWCRERVVTQNKRQPSATNSTAQTTGSDGTITVTDRGVLPLWRTIGEWKKLATDADIARFLLSLYFNPRLEDVQPDSMCVHCSTPLTMCCITCLLSAKQPAPSQSSSSGKPDSHLSAHTARSKGWQGQSQDPLSSEDEMEADFICGNDSEGDADGCDSVSDDSVTVSVSKDTQVRKQMKMTRAPVVVLWRCDSPMGKANLFAEKACTRKRGTNSAVISQTDFTEGPESALHKKDAAALEKVNVNRKQSSNDRFVARTAHPEAEPVAKKTRPSADSKVTKPKHRTASLEQWMTRARTPGGQFASRDVETACLSTTGDTATTTLADSRSEESVGHSVSARPEDDAEDSDISSQSKSESHHTRSKGSVAEEQTEKAKYPICDGIPYPCGQVPTYRSFSEYKCSKCGIIYKYKQYINRHMKSPNCDEGGEFVRKVPTKSCTPFVKKPVERDSDDDWTPSGSELAVDGGSKDAEVSDEDTDNSKRQKVPKRRRYIINKEWTIEEFMTGKLQIPCGTRFGEKREHKFFSHYYCEQCCKVFVSKWTYKSHQKDHLKEKEEGTSQSHTEPERKGPDPESLRILTEIKERLLYCCPHCNLVFVRGEQHQRHVRSHTYSVDKEGRHTCHFCGSSFMNNIYLVHHQRIKKNSQTCQQCGEHFKSKCLIQRHMQVHEDETKKENCEVCGKSLDCLTKKEIRQHLKTHKELQPKSLCSVCGKSVTKATLKSHLLTHSDKKPFSCSVCNKQFKAKFSLEAHSKLHGEKTFQCEKCGEYFYLAVRLKQHMAFRHQGQYVECKECGKKLSKQGALNQHIRMVHQKVLPFACQHCGVRCYHKGDLDKHMTTHTGEKPYQCQYCPSRFAKKAYLILHVRTHTGERPYVCEDCGQGFTSRSGLTLHRRNRHRDIIFPCNECGETFPLQSSLKFHCHKMHGGDFPCLSDRIPSAEVKDITPKAPRAPETSSVLVLPTPQGPVLEQEAEIAAQTLQQYDNDL